MGSGGTDTDPSSCSRTFCSPVSFRYWMKCLRAVGLDASSRNRTSKQGDAEGEHWPPVPGPALSSALTSTQRSLQVNQNLVGEKKRDSASCDIRNYVGLSVRSQLKLPL